MKASLPSRAVVPDDAPAPPASSPGRYTRFFHPLWLALAVLVLAVATHLAVRWSLPTPQCLMRKMTGLPCPSCGCTRSLLAWSHLDAAAAFRFNPLFSLLLVVLAAWLIAWGIECACRGSFLRRWREQTQSWPLGKIFIALALANWAYLCLALPR